MLLKRISRRVFGKRLLLAAAGWYVFSMFPCCIRPAGDKKLWLALGDTLFPDLKNSPDVRDINFWHHLLFTLNDKNYDPDIQAFIRRGWIRFNKYLDKNGIAFENLPYEKRAGIIDKLIEETEWAENWVARLQILIFEAAFLDPHYKVNLHRSGWKWVHHAYGVPRPDDSADYFSLLAKRKKTEIIRSL